MSAPPLTWQCFAPSCNQDNQGDQGNQGNQGNQGDQGNQGNQGKDEEINRLLVKFDDVRTTVKGLVPPHLWEYMEEHKLASGIKVVSFQDANVHGQVRGMLESHKGGLWLGVIVVPLLAAAAAAALGGHWQGLLVGEWGRGRGGGE